MAAGYGAGGEPPAGGPGGPPAIIPPGGDGPNGPSGPQEVAPHAAGALQSGSSATKKKSAAKKKKRPKKKRPLWFRLTRAGLITVFAVVLLGLGAFGAAYALIEVPDATQEGATDQGSTFYYSDGETEFLERGTDRQPVDLDDVPKHVQDAVLAAEDHGFWTEPGVSIRGTGRALWVTLTSRFTGAEEMQGGSTITQQMVRNYYEGLSQEQTIDRKLQEIVIALKVDQQQDKEWILEQYLNTIYMGRQAFGIQAAAQAYFDKDVSELTTEEAAYLAAAIQQPHTFGAVDEDNQENLGSLEGRWDSVMDHMVQLGSMDEETLEADSRSEAEIPLAQPALRDEELTGHTGYMWQQAMTELETLGLTEEDLDTGAYEIVTTFDEDMMTAAQESVEEIVPVDNLPDGVRAGLTAVDPATGEVLAFYGGPGYEVDNYDSAFRGSAQAGSAIKPYVLAAALEQGIGLNTVIDASSPQTFEGSPVQNAGGASYPRVNLVDATARSVNTGYIHLLQQAGQENVVEMMHASGIPDDKITPEQALAPTLALGVSDVSPVDQASGFATFANGGEHIEPHVVRSIIDRDGEDQRPAPERNQAMSEATASDVTYALERVITSGTGTRASIGRPAAGKTGTTDSSVAAWFVGYTPQLSGAVGIYNGDNQPFSMPGYGSLSGGTMPADVWRTFMSRALEGQDVESFSGPSGQGSTHDWGGAEPEPSPAEDESNDEEEPEPEPEETQEEAPVEEEPPADEEELETMPELPGSPDGPEAFAHQNAPTLREDD
ncbi:penicillin-binding protein [Spiractinospora alimapuensis]|nr:penicillin-binding protein [Spiractinospora alimapuensis]